MFPHGERENPFPLTSPIMIEALLVFLSRVTEPTNQPLRISVTIQESTARVVLVVAVAVAVVVSSVATIPLCCG